MLSSSLGIVRLQILHEALLKCARKKWTTTKQNQPVPIDRVLEVELASSYEVIRDRVRTNPAQVARNRLRAQMKKRKMAVSTTTTNSAFAL